MFGKKTVQTDYGFNACATCKTEHTATCSKIDDELANKLRIAPRDPNRAKLLAAAKAAAFNSPKPK